MATISHQRQRYALFADLGKNVPVISGYTPDGSLVCIVDRSAQTSPDVRAAARTHLAVRGNPCGDCTACCIGRLN